MGPLRFLRLGWMVTLAVMGPMGCAKKTDPSPQPQIAAANSYLDAAVRDLGIESSRIMNFVPPGMCPGHFDLTPSQAGRLVSCSVLLVFDFQNQIASSLPRRHDSGLKISVIAPPPGLCITDSYRSIVRQTATILETANLLSVADATTRLQALEERMERLEQAVRSDMERAGIRNDAVLVSIHQEAFARWLGLNPIGTFRGSDIETPGPIQSALDSAAKQPVRWIIANQQEGTELAQSLAKRLSARLVVFSNFPDTAGNDMERPAFDSLIRDNVRRLVEAAR
ncbi:MAG: zinc ABC transporter substrate-binding protein [Phycisphaerae bacterium]|nr:zinc ABC transporter substrate-binding protein [Phycisphaerae bacterium]